MYVHTNFQASTSKDCINNRNANCELPFPLSLVCLSFLLNEHYGSIGCLVSAGGIQDYRIVVGSKADYLLENKFFAKRSQYIRIKNPLHNQSEKACM